MESQQPNEQLNNKLQITSDREVRSFQEVFDHPSKNFQSLVKHSYDDIIEAIYVKAVTFLTINSTGDNIGHISRQFAQDIIETRPDWKIVDIDYFLKFVRQRQDIEQCRIFGNKITGMKLMELVVVYEEHKSEAREKKLVKEDEQVIEADSAVINEALKKIYAMTEKTKPKKKASEVEKQMVEWMALFDSEFIFRGKTFGGKRFIEENGKWVDIDGFLQNRVNKTDKTLPNEQK